MHPLSPDDLIPLEEYVARRAEFFAAHLRYCDRYRRVRIGASLTLLFENRQTLWFRVQEMVRVARLAHPDLVQLELDWYNRLLPQRDHLQAALIVDESVPDGSAADIALELDSTRIPGKRLTDRPEDRATGGAQWLEFALVPGERRLLADRRRAVRFTATDGEKTHVSAYLSDDVRQSLLDDLKVPQREAA